MDNGRIQVDKRSGSGELLCYFPRGTAELANLEYGDFAFTGNGPGGMEVSVGIERKTIRDLLDCMVTGRLSGHQLPGLLVEYDYIYLVVEGMYQSDPDCIKVRHGKRYTKTRLGSKHVDPFLNTLEVVTGVIVRHTLWPRQTASLVTHLYQWWQKGYDRHRSHMGFSVPRATIPELKKPTLVMRIAKELPGIGWKRAEAVSEHFDSVDTMLNADSSEWEKIPGIGSGLAERVLEAIRGG